MNVDCSNAKHNLVLAVIKAIDSNGVEIFRADRIYGVNNFNNAFNLPTGSVKLETEVTENNMKVKVVNIGNVPVFALRLKCETLACWQDNYQSLYPGEEITFNAVPLLGNNFKVNEQITIKAWNL